MKAKLFEMEDAGQSAPIQLESFPVYVGRSRDVEWTLDDRWVSRRHCRIDLENGELVVKDLDSKHGTYVNNQKIDTKALSSGDKLSIGMCTFFVSYEKDAVEVGAS